MPVLSSTTVSSEPATSSASALLMRTPSFAPRSVPTMMAVGVARPSAHGQLITSTDTAWLNATAKSPGARNASHPTSVTAATAMTTGTNTPAMRSAWRSMGALELVASSTRRMMFASVVSAPTAVASIVNQPRRDTVAPVTWSPTPFSAGTGSPVIADSSTEAEPSRTTPSTGTDSPARTTSTSPTRTSSVGTLCSRPSRSTVAVFGARFMSADMELVVLPFARASKYLPSVMSTRIVPAESKYRLPIMAWCAAAMSMRPSASAIWYTPTTL